MRWKTLCLILFSTLALTTSAPAQEAPSLPDAGRVGEAAAKLTLDQTALYFLLVVVMAQMVLIILLVAAVMRANRCQESTVQSNNHVAKALWALRFELADDKSREAMMVEEAVM